MVNVTYKLAEEERKYLTKFCTWIEVAGSIRRKDPNAHDIDIVLVPTSAMDLEFIQLYTAGYPVGKVGRGDKRISYIKKGVQIDLFITDKAHWGSMLMFATGPAGYNIGLRCVAKKQGKFLNQYGLWGKGSTLIASMSETAIYQALGKKWKPPELRGK